MVPPLSPFLSSPSGISSSPSPSSTTTPGPKSGYPRQASIGHSGALGVPGTALVVHTPRQFLESAVKIVPFNGSSTSSPSYFTLFLKGLGLTILLKALALTGLSKIVIYSIIPIQF